MIEKLIKKYTSKNSGVMIEEANKKMYFEKLWRN